jgi:hypothetical protein
VSSSVYNVGLSLLAETTTPADLEQFTRKLIRPLVVKRSGVLEIKHLDYDDLIQDLYKHILKVPKKKKVSPLGAAIAIASCKTGPARYKLFFSNMRKTINRELSRILSKKDPRSKLYSKISKVLEELKVDRLVKVYKESRFYLAANPEFLGQTGKDDNEIIVNGHFPSCKGKDEDMTMPSPSQIKDSILRLLAVAGRDLDVSSIVGILCKGFDVAIINTPYLEDDFSDRKTALKASGKAGPLLDANSDNASYIEDLFKNLLKEIEDFDGLPVEPKPEGKKGRLGKHFVDFQLWNGWPIVGTSKKYGLSAYRKTSGFSEAQESNYKKELLKLPTFVSIKKNQINPEDMKKVIQEFRERFSHRKPKFVENPSS